MEGWALAVAVLAFVFSAFAFLKQFSLQRRVTDIEEARRQDEVTSRLVADVTAMIEHESRPGTTLAEYTWLVLHNRGPAIARDTDVDTEGEGWHVMKDAATLPVTLDAGQRYRIPVVLVHSSAPTIEITIRWRDGTGLQAKKITATR